MVIGFKKQFVPLILSGSKVHTVRTDENKRWKPGMIMHMATGVRTKAYSCFATKTVNAVQDVRFWINSKGILMIAVDGRELSAKHKSNFILNDGFKNEIEFKAWFFPKGESLFTGRLILWCGGKY